MTKFICAVADCKSNSTLKADLHPFMRHVKGWIRFPPLKDARRRQLWEKRCMRGAEWRATKYHAICSRHFFAWENNKPSPKHPDPVLFQYNGWGKNYSDNIQRKQNGSQTSEQCTTEEAATINIKTTTLASQLDAIHHRFLTDCEEVLRISGDVQDWCEVQVSSDLSPSASASTGMSRMCNTCYDEIN